MPGVVATALACVAAAAVALCLSKTQPPVGKTGATTLSRALPTVEQALDRAGELVMLGGRQVKAQVLYKDAAAQVVQVDDFLTAEQCERLRRLAEDTIHRPGEAVAVSPWSTAHAPDAWTRRCAGTCAQNPILTSIDELLETLTSRPKAHLEHYQMLHYEKDQRYGLHHDYIQAQSKIPQGPREFTVLLYLNDVDEGGETHFPSLGVKVQPRRGRALLWPNVDYHDSGRLNERTQHEALPVRKGEKWAASQWVHAGRFR